MARRRCTRSTTTTIKVSDELRDRLKRQAARDGLTIGGHLARLADAEDQRRRFEAMRAAIAATPPTDLPSWRSESDGWERASLDDLRE